jgi:Holliday junction DNA helicase RuvA
LLRKLLAKRGSAVIATITGKLGALEADRALVQVGSVGYEVLLPGYCVNSLSGRVGSDVELCTMEYLEGSPGGGNLLPRIVGFLTAAERDFFGKFISVKGIGIRKGLRSLSLPIATVAAAIEEGDVKLLTSLPEIGKRTAEHIVAELKGKLGSFAAGAEALRPSQEAFAGFQREALEILIAWGEKRAEAVELIELARRRHPEVDTAEALVPLVYRLKQGVEV